SFFNESVASFVADEMTVQFLDQHLGSNSAEKATYLKIEAEAEKRRKKLHATYKILQTLYDSEKTDEEKTEEKEKILKNLQTELKLRRPINNAVLVQYKTYTTGQEEFRKIYERCGRNWKTFLKKLGTLSSKSFGKNQQENLGPVLRSLID
ncbi:MAG: aminopeptidase, partial [Bdellovibrio sp.]|nr:aminopeptidase [Bdellovibrio sp.]